MKSKAELCAFYMRKALHSSKINLRMIIEMLTYKLNYELIELKYTYEKSTFTIIFKILTFIVFILYVIVHNISLENEIRNKFLKNYDLLIFLDSLINVPRSESKGVDLDEISKDLTEIFIGSFNKVKFC